MKKFVPIFALVLIFAFAVRLRGQQITAQNVTTNTVTLPASDAVAKVTDFQGGASVLGTTPYFYWFVSRTASNVSVPAGPLLIYGPATLSAVQNIQITWTPVSGIVSYDLLRTSSSATPSGACNCAVALATKLSTIVDQGAALQSYTVASTGNAWTVKNKLLGAVQALVASYGGVDYQLAPTATVTPSVPIENGSVITVDGTTVTTVAQALSVLPAAGGTIDARSCAPSALNLGTYDPGTKSVVLLLGICTYNFVQVIEEPNEAIIGSGGYGGGTGTVLNETGTTSPVFASNSIDQDLSNLTYTDFVLLDGVSGSATGIDITPSQSNTSAVHIAIERVAMGYFAVPINLHGTGASTTGENEVHDVFIENNQLINFASGPDIQITGSVSAVQIIANDFTGTSLTTAISITGTSNCNATITGNVFAGAGTISSTGCSVSSLLNINASSLLTNSIPNIPTFTGTPTVGHLAAWNTSTGQLIDSGASGLKIECANGTPVTVASTTSETNLMTCTIPAGDISAIGQDLHVRAAGTNSNSSGSNANYEYRLYLDATVIGDTGIQPVTGDKNTYWTCDADLIFTAVGSSGSAKTDAQIWDELNNNGISFPPGATSSTQTFNTTTSHTIKLTVQPGTSAATVAPVENRLVVERLGP